MALSYGNAPPVAAEFAAFAGLDWVDQKPASPLQEQGSTHIESGEMENTPEAIDSGPSRRKSMNRRWCSPGRICGTAWH
jgi:hypothetical protein